MRVLLVGGGGREHAIAASIKNSPQQPRLYTVMGRKNPGIAELSEDYKLVKETQIEDVTGYALARGVELAVIGPEAPLAAGLVDSLEENGIPVFGPRKRAAVIEFDKAWTRNFMEAHHIPGLPRYRVFQPGEEPGGFIRELGEVAVKPRGLTGGKGVKVTGDHFNTHGAIEYAHKLLERDAVVVEEKLEGEEFTLQAFTDGDTLALSPAVQDHKRAYEGDQGPNTGGMGSYNDSKDLLPFMEPQDYQQAREILEKTLQALKKEDRKYQGILYGQFMLTRDGVKVVEFNARLGDPEAMNILPILETDFLEIAELGATQSLHKTRVKFKEKATVCKYVVPQGYPENPIPGTLEVGDTGKAILFYSSVHEENGVIHTTTSRAAAVVGIADTIAEAEQEAEQGLKALKGNIRYRQDIGKPGLIQQRINHMKTLRKNMG